MNSLLKRREILKRSAVGFGTIALTHLLAQEAFADTTDGPLQVKEGHFAATAKRVIFFPRLEGASTISR